MCIKKLYVLFRENTGVYISAIFLITTLTVECNYFTLQS